MSTALTQTTLSAAIAANQTAFQVASTTNILAPVNNVFQQIYVISPGQPRGELMTVIGVPAAGMVQVTRLDKYKAAYPSGSLVLIGQQSQYFVSFETYDPPGTTNASTTLAPGKVQITPWVNILNGKQWLFSSVLNYWVAGWGNDSPIKGPTAAVASAAGLIVPSGPLFHVTGTLAITGFTLPVGFVGGEFTIIPDGIFTWTAATNIGLGGTAVVGKALKFTYDQNSALFYPSYTS